MENVDRYIDIQRLQIHMDLGMRRIESSALQWVEDSNLKKKEGSDHYGIQVFSI